MSNESDVSVYFDNFQVTHTPGRIAEEASYYPYGMVQAGISSKAVGITPNKLKWNGGTELNTDFDINLYETNFRSLDPQLGRFWQSDPMADATFQFSPYSFANNNPLTFNDPLGLFSDTTVNGKYYPDAKTLDNVTVTAKRKVPDEFAPYVSFPNGKPYSVASFKDWPLSFGRDRSNDLLDSWAMGLGATNRVYLPKHPMTKRLMNAYQVSLAKAFFYRKYLSDYKNGLSLRGVGVTNYKGGFGLFGILGAGFDLVEQFVGSMSIDIRVDENSENLLFIVSNTTSKTSAYYHMADSHERSPGNEAMGNLYQVYIWKEPISSLGFSDVTSPRVPQASPTTGISGMPFQ